MVSAAVWAQSDFTGRSGAWVAPHEQSFPLRANRLGICTLVSVNHWFRSPWGWWRFNFLGICGADHSHHVRVILQRNSSCAPFTAYTLSSSGGENRHSSLVKVIWAEAPTALLYLPKITTLVIAELSLYSRFPWSFQAVIHLSDSLLQINTIRSDGTYDPAPLNTDYEPCMTHLLHLKILGSYR